VVTTNGTVVGHRFVSLRTHPCVDRATACPSACGCGKPAGIGDAFATTPAASHAVLRTVTVSAGAVHCSRGLSGLRRAFRQRHAAGVGTLLRLSSGTIEDDGLRWRRALLKRPVRSTPRGPAASHGGSWNTSPVEQWHDSTKKTVSPRGRDGWQLSSVYDQDHALAAVAWGISMVLDSMPALARTA
jgi:hypothetical protein